MTPEPSQRSALSTIVFDFDGVLLQSNAIKSDVYYKIFDATPNADTIVTECLAKYPDVNRVELIGHVLQQLESADPSAAQLSLDTLVGQYTELVEDLTAACEEVVGARQAIESLSHDYSLYINSATVETSLQRVVQRRGWTSLFCGVYGTPRLKNEILRCILHQESVSAGSVLFVGDGMRDYRAASEIGCHFLGVRNEFNDFGKRSH